MHLLLVALCYFICLQINRLFFSFLAPGNVYSVVVGYPLFHDFDINLVFNFYYAEFVAVPLATWILYLQLGSLLGWLPSAPRPPAPVVTPRWEVLGEAARLAVVGFFLGRFFPPGPYGFWQPAVLTAGIYSVAIAAGAWVLGKSTRRSAADWRATLNLLALPFTVLALTGLSSRASALWDAKVVALPWLSPAVAGLVFGVVWVICVTRLFQNRQPVIGLDFRIASEARCLRSWRLFLFLCPCFQRNRSVGSFSFGGSHGTGDTSARGKSPLA